MDAFNKKKVRKKKSQTFKCQCIKCNKKFTNHYLTVFCSCKCKTNYYKTHKTIIMPVKICKYCRNEFIPVKMNLRQKFCNMECRDNYSNNKNTPSLSTKENNKIEKICEYCNNTFKVYPYRERSARFCSKKCHYDSKNHIRICKTCGKEYKSPNHLKSFYCSLDCASIGINKRHSKFSNLVGTILNKNYINNTIKQEYRVSDKNRSIWVDYIITDFNLVIECNGDYWHCNPNIYILVNIITLKYKKLHKKYGILIKNEFHLLKTTDIRFLCYGNLKCMKKMQKKKYY